MIWYLLADHKMLDVWDMIGEYVMRYKVGDADKHQPRGPAHLLITISRYYEFSRGKKKWAVRGGEVFERNNHTNHKDGKKHYQIGFLLNDTMKGNKGE